MAITYHPHFDQQVISQLPIGNNTDWEAASYITAVKCIDGIPVQWVLSDSFGEDYAICNYVGGHDPG